MQNSAIKVVPLLYVIMTATRDKRTECNLVWELAHGVAECCDNGDRLLCGGTCLGNLQSHSISTATCAA